MEGKSDGAGSDTAEEPEGSRRHDAVQEAWFLTDGGSGKGDGGGDDELDEREADAVAFWGIVVNDEDMNGVNESAEDDEEFSFADGGDAAAEEIGTEECEGDGDPVRDGYFLFDKDAQEGDDNDIECGQESCFSCGGVFQSDLLTYACGGDDDAAPEPAPKKFFLGCFFLSAAPEGNFFHGKPVSQEDDGDKGNGTGERSEGGKKHGIDKTHAAALGGKSEAPDDRCGDHGGSTPKCFHDKTLR